MSGVKGDATARGGVWNAWMEGAGEAASAPKGMERGEKDAAASSLPPSSAPPSAGGAAPPPAAEERYIYLELIGEGTYGKVWRARDEVEKKEAAIKVVNLCRDENEGVDVTVVREIGVLRMLRSHPNVAEMVDFFIKNGKEAHMVFDRAECNLYEWQHRLPGSVVPYEKAACIASQMWSALDHLHMHEVMHRDLKPQNLLVEEGGARIRVADFGMARVVRGRLCCKPDQPDQPDQPDRGDSLMVRGAHTPDQVVTVWYRAPEVLLGTTDYTPAIDVWSGACIVVEMCTGIPPFQGDSDIGQMFATFQTLGTPNHLPLPMNTFPHFNTGCLPRFRARELNTVYDLMAHPPHLRVDLPDDTTRLLLDCLMLDWTRRPTAGEAMERMANNLKGGEPSDSKRLRKCVP